MSSGNRSSENCLYQNAPKCNIAAMPAVSKRQFRFMQAVAHGGIKKSGLSPAKAAEFVSGESPKGLPETTMKKRAFAKVRVGGK